MILTTLLLSSGNASAEDGSNDIYFIAGATAGATVVSIAAVTITAGLACLLLKKGNHAFGLTDLTKYLKP